MSQITVRGVSKLWGATAAVDNVSFEADAGSFLVLLGPSGCGKSTTLRLIAGLEQVSSGRILIGGEEVTDLRRQNAASRWCSSLTRCSRILTVAENILFGLRCARRPAAERATPARAGGTLLGLARCSRASRRSFPAANNSAWRSAAPSSPRRRFV